MGFFIIELEHTLPVIDHFNGTTWRTVPSPQIGYGVLSAIAGTSATSIWAVGRKLARHTVTIIEHYNGHGWARVPSPSPATGYIDFTAITAISPHDIWAAGDYINAHGVFRTLTEHYNERTWAIIPSPDTGPGDNYLSAITATGPHQVWAVGRAFDGSRFRPLALTWNGHAWRPDARRGSAWCRSRGWCLGAATSRTSAGNRGRTAS